MNGKSYRRKPKKIVDGDTIELYTPINGKKFVRLSNIDTPEKGQFGYNKAKNQLKGMIGGKTITIKSEGNSYNRVVGELYHNRKSVNKRMKKRGW